MNENYDVFFFYKLFLVRIFYNFFFYNYYEFCSPPTAFYLDLDLTTFFLRITFPYRHISSN